MRRAPFAIGLFVLTIACSSAPQKEINQAQGAIDAARAAGAEQYAKDEYQAATTALQKAHDSVDQRDYRQALSFALDARERAQDAARAAADGKAVARGKAESAITMLAARVQQLETRLKAAEAAHVPAKDLREPRNTLKDTQLALQEAGTALARQDYHGASAAVSGKAEEIDAAMKRLSAPPGKPARPVRRRN